jgi:hypothetical protein
LRLAEGWRGLWARLEGEPPPDPDPKPKPPEPDPATPAPIPVDGFRVMIVYETKDLGIYPGPQNSIIVFK